MRKLIILILLLFLTLPLIKADPCVGDYLGETEDGAGVCFASCITPCSCYYKNSLSGLYETCSNEEDYCVSFGTECTYTPSGGEPPPVNLPPEIYNVANNLTGRSFAVVGENINFSWNKKDYETNVDSTWFIDNFLINITDMIKHNQTRNYQYQIGYQYKRGQTFFTTTARTIMGACANVYRNPSLTGQNLTFELYKADANNYPIGSALTTKKVLWSDVSTNSTYTNNTCTNFTDIITASPLQKYAVVVGGDGSSYNSYYVGMASSGTYLNGMMVYSVSGGSSWYTYSSYDFSNFSISLGNEIETKTSFIDGGNNNISTIVKKINYAKDNRYKICANDTEGLISCLNFSMQTRLTNATIDDNNAPQGTLDIPPNGINVNNYVTIDGDAWDMANINCTQTKATTSSVCGGVALGTAPTTNYQVYGTTWYNAQNLYDDSWTTPAYGSSSTFSYMNITYLKPTGANNLSKWRVKDAGADTQLAIPQDCWDASLTNLSFRVSNKYYVYVGWECWNGTRFKTIRTYAYDFAYDEEMIWSIFGKINNGIANASMWVKNSTSNYATIDGCSNLDTFTFDCIWNIKNETLFPDGSDWTIKLSACDWAGKCNQTIQEKNITIDRGEARIANKTITYPTGKTSAKNGDSVYFEFFTADNLTNINNSWGNFTKINGTEYVNFINFTGINGAGNWSGWNQSVVVNVTSNSSYIPFYLYFYINDSSTPQNQRLDVFSIPIDNQAPDYSDFDYNPKIIYNLSQIEIKINVKDNYKSERYNLSYSGSASGSVNGTIDTTYIGEEKEVIVNISLETGDYNITFDLFDDAGNKNTTSKLNFSVLDAEAGLTINLMYPEDGASITSPTAFGWNYTGGDADTCWLYINNSRVNYTISPLNNTELNWTNSTDSSTNWMVSCNVSSGSEYYSSIWDFILEADTTYPTFTSYTYNVTNGSQFNPIQVYQFNVTITNANGTAWLEFNGTNYTATNISNVYSVVIGTIPAGVYDYNWSAFSNGSNHFRNSSSVQSYTILQNNSYVLGITATTPITYGTTTDAVGTGCPSQLSCALNISNAIYPAGITNFNYSTAGNVNYSGNSTLKAVTINKASTTINLYINGTEDNLVVEYPSPTINTTCVASNTQGELNLTRNSTLVSNGTSPINYTASLERGSYNLTCYYTATENYTGASKSFVLNVSDTTAPTISNLANFSKWTNESMEYDFDATDADGFSINDTRFEINSTGYFKNVSAITTAGLIWINISVNDSYNNIRYDKFYVNYTALPDTTSPYFTYTANQSVYLNTSIGVDFNATDETSFGCFAVNDTRFNINCSGWLKNTTALSVGLTWLNITINDTSNNLNSTIIFINVTAMPDLTPPTWTSLNNKTCYVNKSCTHTISATDTSGIDIYWLNDTTIFSIGNTTGIIVNATKLTNITLYNLNVSVNDTKGNIATGVFWINVTVYVEPNVTITSVNICRYKKLAYWDPNLVWQREVNCI